MTSLTPQEHLASLPPAPPTPVKEEEIVHEDNNWGEYTSFILSCSGNCRPLTYQLVGTIVSSITSTEHILMTTVSLWQELMLTNRDHCIFDVLIECLL